MIHELKIDKEIFFEVLNNRKKVELRRDDRDPPFAIGDVLRLRATRYTGDEMREGKPLEYTGDQCARVVTHIIRGERYGMKDGFVAMSMRQWTKEEIEDAKRARGEFA